MSESIRELLDATTTMYRKGPTVQEEEVEGVSVVHVWLGVDETPDTPDENIVDVHFFNVKVDAEEAERHRDEFHAICAAWPPDPTHMSENRLASGPSYIELGAQIGTFQGQQDALRFMALGEILGAWKVVTPARLHIEYEELANQLAGSGYVMISAYEGP